MDSSNLSSCKENYHEIEEKVTQKTTASDQSVNMNSDPFIVDMEPFSLLTNKDLPLSSRINWQRTLSRKGSEIGTENKLNSNCLTSDGDRDAISLPKEKLIVDQTTDHTNSPQTHHQVNIMTAPTKLDRTPTKSNHFGKRSSSFKQSQVIFNPRRILCLFATLSSMGTILLICLTLSMAMYNEDDSSHASNLT